MQQVYCDGSCLNNGKPNARAGYGIYFGEKDPRNKAGKLPGSLQTNNRGELMAILESLKICPTGDLEVITDSNLAVKTFTEWINTWKKTNWWKSKDWTHKDAKKNCDLILEIDNLIQSRQGKVKFTHVYGHRDNKGNIEADRLANEGALLEPVKEPVKELVKEAVKELSEKEKIKIINERIQNEICKEAIDKLTDTNLIEDYKNSSSVKTKVETIKTLLKKHGMDDDKKIEGFLKDYIMDLIPAGTKGTIRGLKFNQIVKEKIEKMNLDKTIYKVEFEKKNEKIITDEIPDFYIENRKTGKIIIGMNQLDFWNGGHQTNRGSKYILQEKGDEKYKFLNVICNEITFKNKNKALNLFEIGFRDNTLCYLGNLENIIKNYLK